MGATDGPQIDVESICEQLRRHLPNGSQITGLTRLAGGYSNETFLVSGLNLILRLPTPGAALLESAFGVTQQCGILVELGDRPDAPPVPKVVFQDLSGGLLGMPFFLMERAPGTAWTDWQAPDWAHGRPQVFLSGISEQAVDALVALHALAPLRAYGPVRTSGQELGRWKDSIEGVERPEILTRAFALLEAKVPPLAKASPCHGDPKLPNMMWDDGRLTALLDWEMGFNGDPRWDIAYITMPLQSAQHAAFPGLDLPGMWQAEKMVQEWAKRSGRSGQRMFWFEAANSAKITTIHIYGHSLWQRGLSSDARFKALGDYILPFAERALQLAELDAQSAPE